MDHRTVDWTRVGASRFVLHQRFRYDYTGPIRDLRHRLVVVPPARHGDQRRVDWRIDVSLSQAHARRRGDRFGNVVYDVQADRVRRSIEFEVHAVVERAAALAPTALPVSALGDRRWIAPSRLTGPHGALPEAARPLAGTGADGLDLARQICSWVHGAMTYREDVTGVRTTAAQALALGAGVCQDYAHVMLALCRLCGLPARYVSGHLLGEGGSHAWVEVLTAAPDRPDTAFATPFDPTHDRQPGLSYLTIAVGRDYADVAPTSGTFRSPHCGRLSSTKRLGLAAVEWIAA